MRILKELGIIVLIFAGYCLLAVLFASLLSGRIFPSPHLAFLGPILFLFPEPTALGFQMLVIMSAISFMFLVTPWITKGQIIKWMFFGVGIFVWLISGLMAWGRFV